MASVIRITAPTNATNTPIHQRGAGSRRLTMDSRSPTKTGVAAVTTAAWPAEVSPTPSVNRTGNPITPGMATNSSNHLSWPRQGRGLRRTARIRMASGSAMTVRRSARENTSTETAPIFVMIGVPPHTKTVTSAPAVASEKKPTAAGGVIEDCVMGVARRPCQVSSRPGSNVTP